MYITSMSCNINSAHTDIGWDRSVMRLNKAEKSVQCIFVYILVNAEPFFTCTKANRPIYDFFMTL